MEVNFCHTISAAFFFLIIRLPLKLLPVLGPLEWWHVMPTLDAALPCSSMAGSDLGHDSGLVWGALSIGSPHSRITYEPVPIFRYYSVALFNIVNGTTASWCPTIWIVTSHFWVPYKSALVVAPAAIAARRVNWKIEKIYYTLRVKNRPTIAAWRRNRTRRNRRNPDK